MLLSLLLSGMPPFEAFRRSSLICRQGIDHACFDLSGDAWKDVTPGAIDFLKRLLEADSERRVKAVVALNDKWLLTTTKMRK